MLCVTSEYNYCSEGFSCTPFISLVAVMEWRGLFAVMFGWFEWLSYQDSVVADLVAGLGGGSVWHVCRSQYYKIA